MKMEDIANMAADAAIKRYTDKEKKEAKNKKLHNTELLLKNYNSFIKHSNDSKDSFKDIEDDINIDPEDLDDDDLYIHSIRRSRIRTAIMVEQIDMALQYVKNKMNEKGQLEKYEVIDKVYLKEEGFEKAAEELNCSEMTIRRWKNEMIRELSVPLFGVDGVKSLL